MRLQHQWGSVLVAAVLGGLVGVTAAARGTVSPYSRRARGGQRSLQIPLANGSIDYVTLLNARDGGINGVTLVWEECETVFDVTRGIECYERLKAKGPTGAAAFQLANTPLVNALTERATHDRSPCSRRALGARTPRMGGCFRMSSTPRPPAGVRTRPSSASSANGWRHGAAQGPKIVHVHDDAALAGKPSPSSTPRPPSTALRCSTCR